VWQSGFYCPTMYVDAKSFVRHCSRCQRHRNINTRDAVPLTSNLYIDIFDVWGIDFMGRFPNSEGCKDILVAVDYVSKCLEALPCWAADAMHSKTWSHLPEVRSPKNSHQWWRIRLHWLDIPESSHRSWSWSLDCHSISPSDERPSRKIEQANQEYPSKDSESNGQKLEEQAQWSSVGIPNGLQNADRHDTLSASLWENLSPFRRTWTQSFWGHQKVEHGLQGGRNKKENLDCRTWGMEGKGLP
jgi:hypothetical protein